MVRSLWTAASGMISQQTSLDTISNNLANINTTGFKKETAQFKTLLYQTIQEKATDNEGNPKPLGIQAGLGVRNSAIVSKFSQGNLNATENDFDFAIEGRGFFMVAMPDGSVGYTRNGAFNMAVGMNGLTLATAEGYPVLDSTGAPIVLEEGYNAADLEIDDYGNLAYPDETGTAKPMGIKIGLAQFNNPAGLIKTSGSILKESDASGMVRLEAEDTALVASKIRRKYLEGSNVQAVNEMVDLIVTQRAYEMNSKAITASDEMLQQANNLRR